MAGVRVPGGTGWSGTRITRRVTVPTDVDGLRLLRSGVVSVSLLAYICARLHLTTRYCLASLRCVTDVKTKHKNLLILTCT